MVEVGKFMEALQKDPKAKELMESLGVSADDEKTVDMYLVLAQKLGYTFSREDFLNWVQEIAKECKAKSEKAESSMMEALDLEELKMVSGGGNPGCMNTMDEEEECLFYDKHAIFRCFVPINLSKDYKKEKNSKFKVNSGKQGEKKWKGFYCHSGQ